MRRWIPFFSFLFFFLLVGVSVLACFAGAAAKIEVGKTYYLLTLGEYDGPAAEEEGNYGQSVTGGAGYLWTNGEREYVVLACYLKEGQAQSVAAALLQKGIGTEVFPISLQQLALRASEDRADGERLSNAVGVADGVLQGLYQTANGLESGEYSQRQAKALLAELADRLRRQEQVVFAGEKGSYVMALARETRIRLEEICEKIIYARDIRYVLVSLCVSLCSLGEVYD